MEEQYVHSGSDQRYFPGGKVHRVKKAWGEEQWIVNKEYCGKKLLLKKNHRCSMHEHREKDEVFYLQSGRVLLELDGKKYTLEPGDFVHVPAKAPHRFTGLADSEIIEFSTHHQEDDSYRSEFSGHVDPERHGAQSKLLGQFKNVAVLVVGDAMLDTYIDGDVHRLSPEAPIPVLHATGHRSMPGGAANAAVNVASLGGSVSLLGMIGNDASGKFLTKLLKSAGVKSLLQTDGRISTIEKQRYVTGGYHQLLRVDHEIVQVPSVADQKKLLTVFAKELPRHQVVLLSDYAKGVLTPAMLEQCIALANKAGIPVILDPKPRDASYLSHARGATLLTPNRPEASILTGGHADDLDDAAVQCVRATGGSVLFTLGAEGMLLASPRSKPKSFPAETKQVVDVSGAGDTVAAVLALGLGAKGELNAVVDLANRAAGLVVSKAGTARVNVEELRSVL